MSHPRLLLMAPLLLLAACGRSPAPAEPVAPVAAPALAAQAGRPAAVADYLAALSEVEQSKAAVTLETLFAKAEAAQNALMEVTGEQAVLERLSEAEFAALSTELRGLKLHRELDIYAQPDPVFLLALAKAHGRPADIAFFEQYARTWGPDLVPVYLKLRPQPSPCVRFGEDRIAPLYAGWQQFATQHAGAYVAQAAQNLHDIEEAVTLGTCACDGVESVQRELAGFVKQFPETPKAALINARREQLSKDPDVMPVNCR